MSNLLPFVDSLPKVFSPTEAKVLVAFFLKNKAKKDSRLKMLSIPQCPATWGLEKLVHVPSNIVKVGYTPSEYYLKFDWYGWHMCGLDA